MNSENINLQNFTRITVKKYLQNLDGHQAKNMHDFIISEIEKGLILEVQDFTNHNSTKTAKILGITRTTLRNKIKKLNL